MVDRYLEMCSKATEIQKEWYVRIGDEYYDPKEEHYETIGSDDDQNLGTIERVIKPHVIWLPTQSNLQHLMWEQGKINHVPYMFGQFAEWYSEHGAQLALCQMLSMEELWLSFVMYEKYNKEWNGKDWVEIKPEPMFGVHIRELIQTLKYTFGKKK